MYNTKDEMIQERVFRFSQQFVELKYNFKKLIPKLKKYELRELTLSLVHDAQLDVNTFINENSLNISINVEVYEGNLICFGRTIEDNIIWECIQQ